MKEKCNLFIDNIYVDIYNTWINVFAGNSVYECLHEKKLLDGTPKYKLENTDAIFWMHLKANKLLLVFNWNKITHEVIAHECFHATAAILQRKDIPFCRETEEAYAYLLGFLVNKTTELLKEYIK